MFQSLSSSAPVQMYQQQFKPIRPILPQQQHAFRPNTINPSMLQMSSSDLFLAETLFPLTIDTDMPMVDAQASPFDTNLTDDYLADDPQNADSILSTSLPEGSPQNSSPVMFANVGSAPVSVGKKPIMKKARSQSSTSQISASPSQDNLVGEGSYSSSSKPTARSLGLGESSVDDDDELVKHAHMLERQRKRRESHNAVERRRRDNINDRIQELGLLVPDCQNDQKPHKGLILKKTTDYIRHLQRSNQELMQRVQELETKLNCK